jgi:hypothetical protein
MATHYLVVGGTGMLSGVVHYLISNGNLVTVLSRGGNAFQNLKSTLKSEHLHHLSCDYHNSGSLIENLKRHTQQYGLFDMSVCWVHAPSETEICLSIAAYTKQTLLQVVGSASGDPSRPDLINNRLETFSNNYPALNFKVVILGFILEEGTQFNSSRWLYNAEISEGVISAMNNNCVVSVVGTTEPWPLRP